MVQRDSTKAMQAAYDLLDDDEQFTPYCETRGSHAPVAGMMHVHDEDLETVARMRAKRGEKVQCEDCDMTYVAGRGWV